MRRYHLELLEGHVMSSTSREGQIVRFGWIDNDSAQLYTCLNIKFNYVHNSLMVRIFASHTLGQLTLA